MPAVRPVTVTSCMVPVPESDPTVPPAMLTVPVAVMLDHQTITAEEAVTCTV